MGKIENPHGFGAVGLPISQSYDDKSAGKSIAAHFDSLVKKPEVAPFNKYFDDTVISILHELNLPQEFHAIDLGCGNGKTLERIRCEFSLNPENLTGVDLSSEMVDIARRNFPLLNFEVGDIRNALADKKEIADVVLSINAVHYLPDLKEVSVAYKNAHRLLKPGGWFILVTGDHATTAGARDMSDEDIRSWIDDGRKPMDWSMPDEEGKPVFRLNFYPYMNEEHKNELEKCGFDPVRMIRNYPPKKELEKINKAVFDFLNEKPVFVFFLARKTP